MGGKTRREIKLLNIQEEEKTLEGKKKKERKINNNPVSRVENGWKENNGRF